MNGAARQAVLAELGLTRWRLKPQLRPRRRCRIDWPAEAAQTLWAADLLRVLNRLGWEVDPAPAQSDAPQSDTPVLCFARSEKTVVFSGDKIRAPEPDRLAADPAAAAAFWRALVQWSD